MDPNPEIKQIPHPCPVFSFLGQYFQFVTLLLYNDLLSEKKTRQLIRSQLLQKYKNIFQSGSLQGMTEFLETCNIVKMVGLVVMMVDSLESIVSW